MHVRFEDAYRTGWIAGKDAVDTGGRADTQTEPHSPFRDPKLALWWRWGFSNGREERKDVLAI
jgi:hypothetical protein